jgi:hypothetical protein
LRAVFDQEGLAVASGRIEVDELEIVTPFERGRMRPRGGRQAEERNGDGLVALTGR